MIEYEVKKDDTLSSLAQKIGLPDAYTLKTFHNFKGPIEKGIGNEIKEGMILTIPERHEVDAINKEIAERQNKRSQVSSSEAQSSSSETSSENSQKEAEKQEKEEKKESKEKSATEHDGKLFVAQKGKAICDKGTMFPQFKVTSHKKHYINDKNGTADYLAVTENDLQFNPSSVPFGTCSIKNGQPCSYAPTGKWKKFYTDVKILDNALLTEISELQCSVGGKIKILDHGQRAELSKQNFKNADPKVHHYINPFLNLEKFTEKLDGDQFYS